MADRRFPRQNRRGLIEAGRNNLATRSARSAFPGRIAGASLKLMFHPCKLSNRPSFPRQNRRGLIEAATGVRSTGLTATLSPAESPGPH